MSGDLTSNQLSGAAIDTLLCLFLHGPTWDGDVPSKLGRDELVHLGLASRRDGYQWLTDKGVHIGMERGYIERKEKRDRKVRKLMALPEAQQVRTVVIEHARPADEPPAQSSKEQLAPLVQRLNEACVAACDCLVKTPVIHYHQPTCKYRVMQEAASALGALDKCYDAFMIGAKVRTPSTLLANIQNAFRRSNCLSAIEREFFTRKVEDDGSDEIIEDCPMNWGAEPAEYVEQFREALAARAAVEPSDANSYALNLLNSLVDKFGRPEGFQAEDDLLGKLLQIDNVVAGLLARASQPPSGIPFSVRWAMNQLLQDLPQNRDWLNPDIEKIFRQHQWQPETKSAWPELDNAFRAAVETKETRPMCDCDGKSGCKELCACCYQCKERSR